MYLVGGVGRDYFDCGPGKDTIRDFNPSEGDTKTTDCEIVLNSHNSEQGGLTYPSRYWLTHSTRPTECHFTRNNHWKFSKSSDIYIKIAQSNCPSRFRW